MEELQKTITHATVILGKCTFLSTLTKNEQNFRGGRCLGSVLIGVN